MQRGSAVCTVQWLRDEVGRTVQIVMPALPGKAFIRQVQQVNTDRENTAMFWQVPFITNDDGIFEAEFIEDRRRGLEVDNSLIALFWLISCCKGCLTFDVTPSACLASSVCINGKNDVRPQISCCRSSSTRWRAIPWCRASAASTCSSLSPNSTRQTTSRARWSD